MAKPYDNIDDFLKETVNLVKNGSLFSITSRYREERRSLGDIFYLTRYTLSIGNDELFFCQINERFIGRNDGETIEEIVESELRYIARELKGKGIFVEKTEYGLKRESGLKKEIKRIVTRSPNETIQTELFDNR